MLKFLQNLLLLHVLSSCKKIPPAISCEFNFIDQNLQGFVKKKAHPSMYYKQFNYDIQKTSQDYLLICFCKERIRAQELHYINWEGKLFWLPIKIVIIMKIHNVL